MPGKHTQNHVFFERQTQLPEIGLKGQHIIENTRLLIIGLGGLGCCCARIAVSSGFKQVGLLDGDAVELHNLHRQTLYNKTQINKKKVVAAQQTLYTQQFSKTIIQSYPNYLNTDQHQMLFKDYDIIVDCTDDLPCKYLSNELAAFHQKLLISATVYRFQAQLTVKQPQFTGCLNCLFPEPPPSTLLPTCAQAGILPSVVASIGLMQLTQAIKAITQNTPPYNYQVQVDFIKDTMNRIRITPAKGCNVCQQHNDMNAIIKRHQEKVEGVSYDELAHIENKWLLDVRTDKERLNYHLGGTHIPVQKLSLEQIANLPQNKTIICYCESGQRAKNAATLLAKAGLQSVYYLNTPLKAIIHE